MVKIYTKTGDRGETALFGGKRIPKSNLQVEAYGNVDELTSFIGLLMAHLPVGNDEYTAIQRDLYEIMAMLAGAASSKHNLEERTVHLETMIDAIESKLPPLRRFILPQGGVVASLLHVVRTVTRRAERSVVRLRDEGGHTVASTNLENVLRYLNRLSDLMFVAARMHSEKADVLT